MNGHSSFYPRYIERGPRERTLATWYDDDADGPVVAITEHGEVCRFTSLDELAGVGIENRLEILVNQPMGIRWSDLILHSPRWSDLTSKTKHVIGFVYRAKSGRTLVIASARSWGDEQTASLELLQTLRKLFDLCGVGTWPSPGALGDRLIREHWHGPKQPRPTIMLRKTLLNHGVGGRVDTPALGQKFPNAYEIDMRAAYLWAATQPLPVGTAIYLPPGTDAWSKDYLATWWCRCVVYVPRKLEFGPFPIRRGHQVVYPTDPGTYGDGEVTIIDREDVKSEVIEYEDRNEMVLTDDGWRPKRERYVSETPINRPVTDYDREVWLTREQAEDCRAAGCTVITRYGWGWERTEPILREWSEDLWKKRLECSDEAVAEQLKRVAVATISRHLRAPVRYHLAPREQAAPGDVPVPDDDGFCSYVLKADPNPDDNAMTVWARWIIILANRRLYHRMLAEHANGNHVLASNYDAIILQYPSELELSPTELGGWKQTRLGHTRIPAPRAIISEAKTRTPGIPRDRRSDAENIYRRAMSRSP